MKWSIFLLIACFGILGVHNAAASWCVTVTDNSCGDDTWGTSEYTIPEFTDSITIRYDAGNANCAFDIELWQTDVFPPTHWATWTNLCNCGVVVHQPNFYATHIILLKVKCHECPTYNGPDNPCPSSASVKMYSPGNNYNCNSACIPD